MSESATILDPTAGNRSFWRTKESPHIIWIDIEPELEVPPDRVMDCTHTNFNDKQFTTIFFDPPHGWGKKIGDSMHTIRNTKDLEKYRWKKCHSVTYWGWDKYQSKTQLLSFLHKAQKEFYRIIKDDGMLWVKWNECNILLNKILPFFKDWNEMLRFPISSPSQTIGVSQTYWIMFMKNPTTTRIMDLSDIPSNNGKEEQI